MINNISTERLTQDRLSLDDHQFVLELVNTPEWLKYIGERNIKTNDDAQAYIRKITGNTNVNYWVVRLKETNMPVGITTLIKREYLAHSDIGFAFLPGFTNMGYGYEAAKSLLDEVKNTSGHSKILAITKRENIRSITLLEKLGLSFDQEIEEGGEILMVYAIDVSGDKQAN